jgi:hypothetical protein
MNKSRGIALLAAGALVGLSSCDTSAKVQQASSTEPTANNERRGRQVVSQNMKVKIGSKTFTAALDDNPAAAKLRAMLPLTLDMSELNGNEKYFKLPTALPTDATKPGTIQNGDLMLWQEDTLVLFYKTFRTTYGYTRLGRIDDPAGLTAAMGSGNMTVTFESE